MNALRAILLMLLIATVTASVGLGDGLLSGSWTTSGTFNVQSAALSAIDTELTAVYRVNQLTLAGIGTWRMQGGGGIEFDAARFVAKFPVGGIGDVDSSLVFDPNAASLARVFDHWTTTTHGSIAGIGFSHTLYLTEPQTASYQTLVVRGTLGEVEVTSTSRAEMGSDYGWCFASEKINLAWEWCQIPITAEIGFDRAGFDEFSLTARDYPLPGLTDKGIGLYLDLALKFTVDSKTVTPTVSLKIPKGGCIQLLSELVVGSTGAISLDGVNIYGLKLRYQFPDGTAVEEAVAFAPGKNAVVTGQSDYWELLRLSGRTASCCGPGSWSISTYFQATHSTLFDWGMTVFKWEMELGEQLDGFAAITARSGTFGDPLLETVLGWTLRW